MIKKTLYCSPTLIFALVVSALVVSVLATPAVGETQRLETLLAYLKSPNADTRKDAAHKLGERREHDQVAIEALAVAATKDEDEGVRAEAIKSLGLIKSFSALGEMLGGLKDPEPEVRRAAIKALVSLYTEHDIDFITNRRKGWNLLNPFLDTNDKEIIEPYISVDPSIINGLGESARGDHDRDNRISAIRALGVLRAHDAIPQLADALTADHEVRMDVLRAFIKIGDPAAGAYVIPFFRDSDQGIRTEAMVAAGMLKYRPAVEPLMSVYGLGPEKKGPVAKVAGKIKGRLEYLPPRDEAALWGLSLIGDTKSEQVFVENLDDRDGDRRQYSVEGLARIGEHRYLDQISRAILTERNDDVKLAEYWAMYKMGKRDAIQDVVRRLDSNQHDQARQYLLEVDSPADLYPYIHSSDRGTSLDIITILGQIGDRDTIAELKPIVQASGRKSADAATVAIKKIEWRISGRPNATDTVLQRDSGPSRPRRASGQ
jgi:HEAT repeat protein